MSQPLKLFSAPGGPNPFKVMVVLEELNLPYETEIVPQASLKSPPYTDINPNGRAPALRDPNTDVVVWESGAIYEYLLETYDKDERLTHGSTLEKWQEKQWFFLQLTGQGPYWGQAAWFNLFHPEKLESAQDRYITEIHRLVKVLDTHLASRGDSSETIGHPVLVGSKVTYADLIFVLWHEQLPTIFSKFEDRWNVGDYPSYKKWVDGLKQRTSVRKALESQNEVLEMMMKGEYQ